MTQPPVRSLSTSDQGSPPYSSVIIHNSTALRTAKFLSEPSGKKIIIKTEIKFVLEPAPAHYVFIMRLYTWADDKLLFGNANGVGPHFGCFPSDFYLAVREEDNCTPPGGGRGTLCSFSHRVGRTCCSRGCNNGQSRAF